MKKKIYINTEAKEYILSYLEEWIDELGKFPTSFRKGIIRAIYNKVDSIPVDNSSWKEFTFQSMIPVQYDENNNVIIHEYINYKCNQCGYKNGDRKTNYCPNCGRKMVEYGTG